MEAQFVKNHNFKAAPHRLRTIHLDKPLQKLCGVKTVELAASNFAQIVSGLTAMFGPKVKQHIVTNAWRVRFDETRVDQSEIHNLGEVKNIRMNQAVVGSGGRTGQIILGVVMIVVGAVLVWGTGGAASTGSMQLWAQGATMLLGGAMTIYAALNTPKAQAARAAEDERASFLFNGAVNVVEQGGAVPCHYGRCIIGSTVVSAGIDTEQIATYTSPVGGNIAPNSAFNIETQYV